MKITRSHTTNARVISFILTLLLIFYTVPATVFAEALTDSEGEAQTPSEQTEDVTAEAAETSSEVLEMIDLREENVKHFRLEDGTYLAASYVDPVHYKDEDGNWQDIDNRLFSIGGDFTTTNARIKFSKKITGNENLFTLREDGAKLTLSLVGAKKKTEGRVTTDYTSDDIEETKLGKMMNLEKLMSKVLYEDILDGVDLEYVVYSNNVKENIIVKEKAESYSYTFSLKLNQLTAALSENGDIVISDEQGNAKYIIPAPIVYDAVGQIAPNGAAYYTLTEDGKNYTLTVSVNSDWMNSEEIMFPVTIDPTIEDTGTTTYVQDRSAEWNAGDPYLVIESASAPTYFKINALPELGNTTLINEAKVNLKYLRSSGRVFPTVALYNVQFPLNGQTEEIVRGNTIIDYELGANPKWTYTFDVTSLVQSWYANPNDSHGFAVARYVTAGEDLLVTGGGNIGVMHLYSTESIGTYSTSPFFEISYIPMIGVEDYWSFTSQSAGNAGIGQINLATGNLVFSIPTLSSTDQLMPVTPTLVYNSALANKQYVDSSAYTAYKNSFTPYGFKLNLNETITLKEVLSDDNTVEFYYVLADSDGTYHYFKSGVWEDQDGLGLKMELSSDDLIIITDKNKTKKYFVAMSSDYGSGWYLAQIEDKVGNKVLISADSAERPSLISLIPKGYTETINMLIISYNSAGVISQIRSLTNTDNYVTFNYSDAYNGAVANGASKYLKNVNYHFGTSIVTSSYIYSSGGLLTKVEDNLSGGAVEYSYSGKGVSRVCEYGKDAVVGQTMSLSFCSGYTKLRTSGENDALNDADDIITTYVYDSNGRVINYYSTDASGTNLYGATFGKYDDKDNSKNNIKETNTLNGSSVNYLLNGDFENWTVSSEAPVYWTKSQLVSRYSNVFNGHNLYSAKFLFNSESESYVSQTVSLNAGTYTLSLDIDTYSFVNGEAYVEVAHVGDQTPFCSKRLATDKRNETGFMTESLTFTLNDASDVVVTIKAIGNAAVSNYHTLIIDNVMLTNSESVGRYNKVDGGHFETILAESEANEEIHSFDLWSKENATLTDYGDVFGTVLQINGSSGTTKESKQRIFTASSTLIDRYDFYPNDFVTNAKINYTVSCFGYLSKLLAGSASFKIRADVYYYQGYDKSDVVVSHDFDFVNETERWQFVSGSFSGEYYPTSASDTADYRCIHYIDIVCVLDGQPSGYALFDNLSVIDSTQTGYKYGYDDAGLLKIRQSFYYTEYYHYYDNENLWIKANDRGELYVYDYNEQNQVIEEVYYHYTLLEGVEEFPTDSSELASKISKLVYTITEYTYTEQGLLSSEKNSLAIEGASGVYADTQSFYRFYEYSEVDAIFGALVSADDYVNRPVYYFYDETNGRLLASLQNGFGTAYSYDALGRMTGVKPATGTERTLSQEPSYSVTENAENLTYVYNTNGELASIVTDSTTYHFTYDSFGNSSEVKVDNSTLATYEYNPNNGKLKKVTYGNGFSEEYFYNDLEMLSEVWYNYSDGSRECAVKYIYTTDGSLSRVDDCLSGISTVYVYDTAGRVSEIGEYKTADMSYYKDKTFDYDSESRLTSTYTALDYLAGQDLVSASLTNYYSYTTDGKISSGYVKLGARFNTSYSYDLFDRVTKAEYSSQVSTGFKNVIEYKYRTSPHSENYFSGTVSKYTSRVGRENVTSDTVYEYSYDERDNIIGISVNGSQVTSYQYDDLGQLIRENNFSLGKTYVYTYDNAGNILTKETYSYTTSDSLGTAQETNTYTYGNESWGDQLTAFDGEPITYDSIGNPLEYYNGFEFGWTGRNLVAAEKDEDLYTFVYNSDGLRTQKTVNGVVHTYHYNGTELLAEQWIENGTEHLMVFVYDANGVPLGLKYRNSTYAQSVWDSYWYERNLQGDIVAIYNDSNVKLASYTYDAWGNHTVAYSNGGNSILAITNNPIRYRGYYYDTDLGLYYLQTRYYDSNIGRFINPDSVMSGASGSLHGANLFVYCFNNPISMVDSSGSWPKWVEDAAGWVNDNIIQPVVNFVQNVAEDISNYDPNNESEDVVFSSNYFSNYKGAVVIKTLFDSSFSFGFIGLSIYQQDSSTLNHEYGHTVQMKNMKILKYTFDVAIPSITINVLDRMGNLPYDYYTYPFEAEADKLGNTKNYQDGKDPLPQGEYDSFWSLIPLFFK